MSAASILLVAPSLAADKPPSAVLDMDDAYPVGLAYLHAAIEAAGHFVRTLDCRYLSFLQQQDAVLDSIAQSPPDVVGIQVLSEFRAPLLALANRIRQLHPGVQVVLGGPHVTVRARQIILRNPGLIIAVGEAENTLVRLADCVTDSGSFHAIPGLVFFADRLIDTGPPETVLDLDTLPFPKHAAYLTAGSRYASVMTSRGCPFACSFCAVARQKPRLRSLDNILAEIEYIDRTFPAVEVIRFWDDQFFLRPQRVIDLCNALAQRKSRMRFTCLARLKPFTAELLQALERANFIEIGFGLESGSTRVSDENNKGIDPATDAVACVRLLAESPMRVFMFLIVGQASETWQTIEETCRLCLALLRIRYVEFATTVGIATIYPGTELERRAIDAGLIGEDHWELSEDCPVYAVDHDLNVLRRMREYILEHVDISSIVHSRATMRHLQPAIDSVFRHLIRTWGQKATPHCDPAALGAVVNRLALVLAGMSRQGTLQVSGASLLRGPAEAVQWQFEAEPGYANRFRVVRREIRPDSVVVEFLRWLYETGRQDLIREIQDAFCRSVLAPAQVDH